MCAMQGRYVRVMFVPSLTLKGPTLLHAVQTSEPKRDFLACYLSMLHPTGPFKRLRERNADMNRFHTAPYLCINRSTFKHLDS